MDINFNGKKALVTGAGRGIGRELVKRLVKAGAKVIAVSRTESHLKSLEKEICSSSFFKCPSIKTIAVDVADWDATQNILNDIGHVDLLVNNAGILEAMPFGEITEEFVDKTMNVNLKAILNISQIVIKEMKKKGTGGCIVNVSSIGSKYCFPGLSVYQSLKAALDQMTRVMAIELGPHKIRINTVNPTAVNTDMVKEIGYTSEMEKQIMASIPLGRYCEPSDVVDTIIYLLSDKAAMIHGANIYVDGGHTVTVG